MKKTLLLALVGLLLPLSTTAETYPDMRRTWLEGGQIMDPAVIKQVTVGMHKSQLYRLIGAPNFSEGIDARTWNYLFQLRNSTKTFASNCQYQLHFDNSRVTEIMWQTDVCAKAAK